MSGTANLHYEGVFSLDENSVLLFGRVNFCIDNSSVIKLDNKNVKRPYTGTVFPTPLGEYYFLILKHPGIGGKETIHTLSIDAADTPRHILPPLTPHARHSDNFVRLFEQLATAERQKIFDLFIAHAEEHSELGESAAFMGLCIRLHQKLEGRKLAMTYGCWIAPHVLYFEGKLEGFLPGKNAQLLVMSSYLHPRVPVTVLQTSHTEFSAVAVFDHEVYTQGYENFVLTVFDEGILIPVTGAVSSKCYALEFIAHVGTKEDLAKHLIREAVNRQIIEYTKQKQQPIAAEVIRKHQYFIKTAPMDCSDSSIPFGIHFEQVIPIAGKGVFVFGWMHDAYNLLLDVEAISDLGFTLSLKGKIHRFGRGDVQEHFRNTPYGGLDNQMGAMAYAEFDDKTAKLMAQFGGLHNFRFNVKLTGGITLLVNPAPKYRDVFSSREFLLKGIAGDAVSDTMLQNAIGPAAALLQKLCMQQTEAAQVVHYGKQPKAPLVSLIVPLYKRLDFLKIQFATLARDTERDKVELIFVLDSPEQEHDVKNILLSHSELYDVPVTLVVMNRNAGYARANNEGAKQARGKYLVLLNSDVFAITRDWALKMAAFYAKNPKIGALAPKLLYEDGSLQHAGMFFAKNNHAFWLNIHYYKGFPSDHAPACINRPVPAVTGACLMMSTDLYRKVGGLTTDYVIGDFEDSDLCMKVAKLGYESWYYADAELYHLERQSVPLNATYSGGLAWRQNAHTHTNAWDNLIKRQMELYGQPPLVEEMKPIAKGASA